MNRTDFYDKSQKSAFNCPPGGSYRFQILLAEICIK